MHRSVLRFFLPLALALVLALSFSCTTTIPDSPPDSLLPTPYSLVEYYEISGTTAQQLRSQMNQRGPLQQGQRYDGWTQWEINWRYEYESSHETCSLTSHKVTTQITITLPRWTNQASASPELQRRWDNFWNALQAHENNHVRLSLQAATEVENMLDNLAPQSTCDALEAVINSKGQNILQANRERNAAYDRETNHGMSEGVRFP